MVKSCLVCCWLCSQLFPIVLTMTFVWVNSDSGDSFLLYMNRLGCGWYAGCLYCWRCCVFASHVCPDPLPMAKGSRVLHGPFVQVEIDFMQAGSCPLFAGAARGHRSSAFTLFAMLPAVWLSMQCIIIGPGMLKCSMNIVSCDKSHPCL